VSPEPLPWVPFYWVRAVTDSARFDHAAMLFRLQVRPVGPPSIVQLDLGGSGGMPDGFPLPARDFRGVPPIRKGQLYGLLGTGPRLALLDRSADSAMTRWQESEVGTVGLPNFLSRTLILDFPNRRLASIPGRQSFERLLDPAAVTLQLEQGRYDRAVVPLSTATGAVYRALLDTGLSPFPLWTTRAIWEQLTGLGGPGRGTRTYRFGSRRGEFVFVAARPRTELRLATWTLQPPEVVYLSRGPVGASIEEWSSGVDIVLGASLWARSTVVLIDLTRHRIALARKMP
jgi:hypothetical protein